MGGIEGPTAAKTREVVIIYRYRTVFYGSNWPWMSQCMELKLGKAGCKRGKSQTKWEESGESNEGEDSIRPKGYPERKRAKELQL